MVRSAGRSRLGALAVVALLVAMMVVATAGCSSSTQAASETSGSTPTGQNTTGTSLPSGRPSGVPQGIRGGTFLSGGPGMTTSSTGSTTTTAASTTTEAPATTSLADGQYGDGIYKAGTDVDADLYKGRAVSDTAHWEITSDANGAKYVASGDPTGSFYVKVSSGQYLRLNGVIIEEASSEAADPLASTGLSDGTYRVGYDIEPGWYTGSVTGESTLGYWQISSDANGQTLVANDYPMDSFTLKVKKGQYLTLRGVTISLQQ